MDWKDIAGKVIKLGAPVIGTALGGPLGGGIASAAGTILAGALGLDEATPEAVNNAITTGEPSAVRAAISSADDQFAAKIDAIKAAIAADADVAKTSITAVNATMQSEIGRIGFWHWRNLLGYVVGFELFVFPTTVLIFIILARDPTQIIAYSSGALVSILAIGAGLLGFVANDNTKRTTTALLGEHPTTITSAIASRIQKK